MVRESERDRLVAAISVLVDDDQLIEIMEKADASDDPVTVLQLSYDELTSSDEGSPQDVSSSGL